MTAPDLATITGELADHVGNQMNAVTFKWVARHFNIPYDTSKRVLFEFIAKSGDRVKASYLLSGWTKDAAPRHIVRVVDAAGLDGAKATLASITSLHVYAVQPTASADPDALQNVDYAQTEELFRRMLEAPAAAEPGPLAADLLSSVRCEEARRDPATAAALRPATATKPAAPKPAAPAAAPKKATSPAKKAAAAMFAGAAKKKEEKKPAPKASKKAEPAAKKPSKPAAPVETATTGPVSDDDDDDMVAPVPRAATGKSKRAMIGDSDSDLEEAPKPKVAKKEPAPKKEKKAAPKAGGKRKAKEEPAVEEEAVPKAGTVKVHATQPGGKRTRRVMKTYFNDAGEEVTEMVEETDDEAPAAAPAPAAAAPSAPKPKPSGPAAGKSGTAPKKSGGKGAPAAGQRSIASFFGGKK